MHRERHVKWCAMLGRSRNYVVKGLGPEDSVSFLWKPWIYGGTSKIHRGTDIWHLLQPCLVCPHSIYVCLGYSHNSQFQLSANTHFWREWWLKYVGPCNHMEDSYNLGSRTDGVLHVEWMHIRCFFATVRVGDVENNTLHHELPYVKQWCTTEKRRPLRYLGIF